MSGRQTTRIFGYLIIVFLLLLHHVHLIRALCQITPTQISTEKRTFAINSGRNLEILRQDFVADGTNVFLFCTLQDLVVAKCQNGTFNITIPAKPICKNHMKEKVVRLMDANCNALGGQMYGVGYELRGEFQQLYASCYDQQHVKALYAVHDAYHFDAALSAVFRRPRFSQDNLLSGASTKNFMASSIYARFNELLGLQQTYAMSPTHTLLHRGHLAPSGDFVFFDQMGDTFKLLNVMLQFANINQSIWKRIENWVRTYAKLNFQQGIGALSIVTGSLEVLQLPHSQKPNTMVPIYLESGDKNPIPKWIFKAVRSQTACYIYMVINEPTAIPSIRTHICKTTTCPAVMTPAFCCDISDFKRRYPKLPVC